MSNKEFDPNTYKGVSVLSILEKQAREATPRRHFSTRIRERFLGLEQAYISSEGEPMFFYNVSTALNEGVSLKKLAREYGINPQAFARFAREAAIPYASREEAVKRLWNDPQFRRRNSAALLEGRAQSWRDPKKRRATIDKLRDNTLKQWENPNFRESVTAAATVTFRRNWQDPVCRAKMVRNRVLFDALRNDPDYLARLSQIKRAQWSDEEFYARNAEISRRNLATIKKRPSYRKKRSEQQKNRWKDPEYRKKMSEAAGRNLSKLWQDPDFYAAAVERGREIMTRLSNDPGFREAGVKARRERMADTSYRDQISELRRQIALGLWADPDYRTRLSDIHVALWQDPEYRERQAETIRQARLDPANRDHFILPTIYGFRSDIGFHAQSAWEANVARVLKLVGREFIVGVNLRLVVTENFQELFQDQETVFNVDFSTIDSRGGIVMYELMAHPLEDPEGWAKLEMAKRQHPDLNIRAIDQHFYDELSRKFENPINNHPQLHGWERTGFNLRTHPEVFS